MTVTIEPQNEAKLHETSQQRGLDVNALVNAIITEAFRQQEDEALLQQALTVDPSQPGKPLAQYLREQRLKWNQPDTWPSEGKDDLVEVAPGRFKTQRFDDVKM